MVSPSQRIVSLLSSATEILVAIGLMDRLVAVSHECDFPPAVTHLPRVTRSRIDSALASLDIDNRVRELSESSQPLYAIDAKQIAALRPDLIVTQSQCDVCAVSYDQVLEMVAVEPRLKGTQVLALNPIRLADVLADIARIGQATAAETEAREFIDALKHRIAAVVETTKPLPVTARPRTICIEWIKPIMLAANWTPEIIELAGGQNGLTIAGKHSTYANWDALTRYDPQVVLIAPCGFDLARTLIESRELPQLDGWNSLSAVRESRVFAIDGNAYFNRSGPRLVESLETAAYLIQPSLFPCPPNSVIREQAFTRFPV